MEKTSVPSALREGLRSNFERVLNEPLPDALAELVRRLRTSEEGTKAAKPAQQTLGAAHKRPRRR
jgi:hypothetical protein